MATFLSHAIAAASLGSVLPASTRRRRLLAAGIACALLPDVDVLWSGWEGAPDLLAHRGLTHSLFFALLLAALIGASRAASGASGATTRRGRFGAALWILVATASHGVLDAMTDGGEGVAFLAPFHSGRWFLPWRPIAVSPLLVGPVLRSWREWQPELILIARTELEWIVVPSLAFACVVGLVRALRREGGRRRAAWRPAAALAVVVASLVPIRSLRPARPPIDFALLLHASELVVVARVDSIASDGQAATPSGGSGWVRQIDDVRRRGRRARAEVVEALRGEPAQPLEFFVMPHPDDRAADAIEGETDLFLLTDAARGDGGPPAWIVLARLRLVDEGGRRSVEIPTERVELAGGARSLPFDALKRMIAAADAAARSDR